MAPQADTGTSGAVARVRRSLPIRGRGRGVSWQIHRALRV
jgi:hypothetical protein